MQNNTKLYFSRADLAEMFGVTPTAILLWEKAGKLTPVKLAKSTVRYSRENVEQLITNSTAGSTAHATQAQ